MTQRLYLSISDFCFIELSCFTSHPLLCVDAYLTGVLPGGYVGTDALCLVEYFGTHDFGWCKTDVMFPYEQGGKFKLPEDKKEAGYSDTVTKDANAVEEADGSFDYMKVS